MHLMSAALLYASLGLASNEGQDNANFTIVNGQIYTPGLAIIDAPQPFTPEGGGQTFLQSQFQVFERSSPRPETTFLRWRGPVLTFSLDFLHVAIDVSGNGRLPLPPYDPGIETGLFNITLFLTSYAMGLNLTISNGTTAGWVNNSAEPSEFRCNDLNSSQGFQNAGCKEVMLQESGSTVKHVNWVWPGCLVGDGKDNDGNCGNSRGSAQNCLDGNARGPYNVRLQPTFQ